MNKTRFPGFISVSLLVIAAIIGKVNASSVDCDPGVINIESIQQQVHAIFKLADINHKDAAGMSVEDPRPARFSKLFQSCINSQLSPQTLASLNRVEIHRLFTMLDNIIFITGDADVAGKMAMILKHKEATGQDISTLLVPVYKALVTAREFVKAKALTTEFPDTKYPQLPTVVEAGGGERMLYQLDEQNDKLIRRGFKFPQDGHVVVVSAPICNPCKRLFNWLKTEPELHAIIIDNTTWITPVVGELYLDEMRQTHQDYAPIRLQYTYKEQDWPEITYWGTPSFYFYQGGQLVKQVVGWPSEGRKKALLKGLESISLI